MKKNIVSYTILALISLISTTAFTAESEKAQDNEPVLLRSLNYPELQVTPLASQRLQQESEQENSKKWLNLAAIQISGLMTFYAGTQVDGDYDTNLTNSQEILDNRDRVDGASALAKTIGGAWFIGATALSAFYNPYNSGFKDVKSLLNKTKQQKLIRERMAEEKLEAAGKLGRKLKYLSVFSNAVASALVMTEGQDDTKLIGALSALTAFAPLLFESQWEITAETHQNYKKKIYGPISGWIPGSQGLVPALGVAMTF